MQVNGSSASITDRLAKHSYNILVGTVVASWQLSEVVKAIHEDIKRSQKMERKSRSNPTSVYAIHSQLKLLKA